MRSAVIDIFSPRIQQPQQSVEEEGANEASAVSGMSSLTSDRTAPASEGTSQASGGRGGAASNASGNSSQPRVRKKATFSDTVTEAVAGEQRGMAVASLQPSESLGKDESLGARSGVTSTTGAGSLAGLDSDDDEDGESIVAIKHKLVLLEKQQDVEKFSIERYTSRLITFWCVQFSSFGLGSPPLSHRAPLTNHTPPFPLSLLSPGSGSSSSSIPPSLASCWRASTAAPSTTGAATSSPTSPSTASRATT